MFNIFFNIYFFSCAKKEETAGNASTQGSTVDLLEDTDIDNPTDNSTDIPTKFFVVAGYGGTIATSSDNGTTWTDRWRYGTGDIRQTGIFRSLAYGNGTAVAVGDTGKIASSQDMITWKLQDSGTSNKLEKVIYDNGTFVAVGQEMITSSDGITWIKRKIAYCYDVTYGNGTFVAVGNTGVIYTSSDNGANWDNQTSGVNGNLYTVTFDNGTFIAAGDAISTSKDNGSNWVSQTLSGVTNNFRDITYGNGVFVAVGDYAESTSADNGSNWVTNSSGRLIYAVTHGFNRLSSINNGSVFVAAGSKISTSTNNGSDWVIHTLQGVDTLYDITYGDGVFVAVGNDAKIFTSSDGTSWNPSTLTRPVETDEYFSMPDLRDVIFINKEETEN